MRGCASALPTPIVLAPPQCKGESPRPPFFGTEFGAVGSPAHTLLAPSQAPAGSPESPSRDPCSGAIKSLTYARVRVP